MEPLGTTRKEEIADACTDHGEQGFEGPFKPLHMRR